MPKALGGDYSRIISGFAIWNTKDELAGVLVECDPSIKAIIERIDVQNGHGFIIENIDDEHVLIRSTKHEELKALLKDVSPLRGYGFTPRC